MSDDTNMSLDPAGNPALSEADADAAAQDEASDAARQAEIDAAVQTALAERDRQDAEARAAADAAREEAGVAPLTNAKRITIILEENDDIPPTGLFVGINGRSYLVRAGEEVSVPEEVVYVLNDAVMATPRTDQQGNVVDYRNKLRFPYRIVSGEL